MTRARGLGRLIAELRAAPGEHDAREALARLGTRRRGDVAEIAPLADGAREPLGTLTPGSVQAVHLARGVYGRVPTRAGRVALLEIARRAAREHVVVHVVVTDENSHLGRLAIDAPRRALRVLGASVAEPGDRGVGEHYAHCFFDEESLLLELASARLGIAKRDGFTFTLRHVEPHDARASSEHAQPLATELARVARLVREVDAARASGTPQDVLAATRARGGAAPRRGPVGRARLRRAIGWVDAFMPGGANCYRRILLEVALDAGAATETVVFGLDVGSTGHVAFESREERSFDVAFAIPAPRP